ncbi:hypothetical protein V8C34DRAFT_58406 [Trichoderma compactum]
MTANNNGNAVSRSSSAYRTLDCMCKIGLKDPINKGPTSAHFMRALMDVEGMAEARLPSSWATFAGRNPDIAPMLRRDAQNFPVEGMGEFNVFQLPAGCVKAKYKVRRTSAAAAAAAVNALHAATVAKAEFALIAPTQVKHAPQSLII